MTKLEVLRIFAQSGSFLKPDEIWHRLGRHLERRSLYSYLDRLRQQGLLERGPNSRRGRLTYRLTLRGRARIEFLGKRLR